jgi:hypothetical protein
MKHGLAALDMDQTEKNPESRPVSRAASSWIQILYSTLFLRKATAEEVESFQRFKKNCAVKFEDEGS